ncbi:MAG TPA: universal stress protein [Solirubrobacterales bacterium]|nr:universal stress protein [Solirubrobacterales bacterium]
MTGTPRKDAGGTPRKDAGVPPRRVVIGCNGSEGAFDAVAVARLLAGDEPSFLLVDVAPRGPLGRRFSAHVPGDFSIARHALAVTAGPDGVETRSVHADSAAEVLADIAADERHDLIVVGSPHRGPLGRILLGSVARDLIHRSSVPVAIAPRGFGHTATPARIVVGFDGSPEAEAALEWADAFAAARHAELDVFTVATPPGAIPGALGHPAPGPAEPFEALEAAADRIAAGTTAHAHLRIGPAAPNLSAAAATADLLVVGTRLHGAPAEALVGSVADELVTAPRCPVVVVPLRNRPSGGRRSRPDGESTLTAEDARA